jgi:hypothetical protein
MTMPSDDPALQAGNPPAETPFEALPKLEERLEGAEEMAEEMMGEIPTVTSTTDVCLT